MGVYSGPEIVKDGLVLHLDAATNKSFRGEPTVNLINQTSFENWSKSATVTQDGFGLDGTPAYKIEDSSNTLYQTLSTSTISVLSSTTYTYSVWFVVNSSMLSQSHFRLANNGYLSLRLIINNGTVNLARNDLGLNSSATSVSTGISERVFYNGRLWCRGYVTFTTPSTVTAITPEFYPAHDPGAASTVGFVTAWGPQLEQKPYPTPFVNGTRGTTVATGGGWADLSGNTNHGELVNGPTFNSDNLGSLVFDGVNNVVDIQDNTTLDFSTNNFTIISWVKLPNISQAGSILYRRLNGSPFTQIGFGAGDTGADNGFITSSSKKIFFVLRQSGTNQIRLITNDEIIATSNNNWFQNVFIRNNGVINYYYNGNQLSLITQRIDGLGANSNINFSGDFWKLGNSNTSGQSLTGNISQFQIYNRALTPQEVRQNFYATRGRYGV
jgi:hypothetical protein